MNLTSFHLNVIYTKVYVYKCTKIVVINYWIKIYFTRPCGKFRYTLGCPKIHLFPWNIPWPGANESLSDVLHETYILSIPKFGGIYCEIFILMWTVTRTWSTKQCRNIFGSFGSVSEILFKTGYLSLRSLIGICSNMAKWKVCWKIDFRGAIYRS